MRHRRKLQTHLIMVVLQPTPTCDACMMPIGACGVRTTRQQRPVKRPPMLLAPQTFASATATQFQTVTALSLFKSRERAARKGITICAGGRCDLQGALVGSFTIISIVLYLIFELGVRHPRFPGINHVAYCFLPHAFEVALRISPFLGNQRAEAAYLPGISRLDACGTRVVDAGFLTVPGPTSSLKSRPAAAIPAAWRWTQQPAG